jgi:molybdate transport system permease protein
MPLDWSPLWLSLRYAGLATLPATLAALPLAWLFTHRRGPGSELPAAADLPLFLPPAVLVYYLLAASGIWNLHFSWDRAVGVSAVCTLPVLLGRMGAGLAAVDRNFEQAARVLGAGEWRTFWRVAFPLAWRALGGAVLAGFLRAFADFALTLIVAGHGGKVFWLPLAGVAVLDIARRMRRGRVAA